MKLEIKHLAPYLPYKLKLMLSESHNANNGIHKFSGLSYEKADGHNPSEYVIRCHDLNYCFSLSDDVKPILRRLELLTEHDLDNSPYLTFNDLKEDILNGNCPYWIWIDKVEKHFDVFGLIDAGLAIDINTL